MQHGTHLREDIMNVIVHLMFAMTVRRRVKKSMGVSLSFTGFLYGNILPDISKKYGAYPHYMKDALAHVVRTKDEIIEKSYGQPLSKYRFAKELGAINHYLSDFFCLPHTEDYYRGKIYHLYYELLMIARYRKGLIAYRRLLKEHSTRTLMPKELKSFIVEHNKIYRSKSASDIKDIGYALFAGIKLIECVIAHSIANSTASQKAASA